MSDRIAVINHGRIRQIGNPTTSTTGPTPFVAEFIGESPFLPVAVRRRYGLSRRTRHAACGTAAAPAEAQMLVLRPEKLKVIDATDGAGLNVFDGQVKEFVYQGREPLLYVSLADGQPIAIRATRRSAHGAPPPGAPIRLGLAPADTIIVPSEEA